MYEIINKGVDGDQQAITVRNKENGEELTYYECEIDGIKDEQLRDFLIKRK